MEEDGIVSNMMLPASSLLPFVKVLLAVSTTDVVRRAIPLLRGFGQCFEAKKIARWEGERTTTVEYIPGGETEQSAPFREPPPKRTRPVF